MGGKRGSFMRARAHRRLWGRALVGLRRVTHAHAFQERLCPTRGRVAGSGAGRKWEGDVYERKQDKVFYVIPVESILGMLPVVPIGDTGTIPFCNTPKCKGLCRRRV